MIAGVAMREHMIVPRTNIVNRVPMSFASPVLITFSSPVAGRNLNPIRG
jgi:hypothetical protein